MSDTKLLVISDSHGNAKSAREAIEREQPFDILVHCGDVTGSLAAIVGEAPEFEIRAVRGNCDPQWELPEEELFSVGTHRIWVTHGHHYMVKYEATLQILREAARERGANIVLFGHTHRPELIQNGSRELLLNPGSIGAPRFYGGKSTYAVLTLSEDGTIRAEMKEVV